MIQLTNVDFSLQVLIDRCTILSGVYYEGSTKIICFDMRGKIYFGFSDDIFILLNFSAIRSPLNVLDFTKALGTVNHMVIVVKLNKIAPLVLLF